MPADNWERHSVATCVLDRVPETENWWILWAMFCRCMKSMASGRAGGCNCNGKDLSFYSAAQGSPASHPCCLNFYQEQYLLGTLYKKTRILFSLGNVYLSWTLSCWLWRWLCHVAILRSWVYVCGNKTCTVLKTSVLSHQSSFVLKRVLLRWDFY